MIRYQQIPLAIFSISLILLLGLANVNKTIHDGLFHYESSSNSSSHQGCPSHQGCSSNENDTSRGEDPYQDTNGCDSSCPVNIFSSGVLSLEYFEDLLTISSSLTKGINVFVISHICDNIKKSNLVRGPPQYS